MTDYSIKLSLNRTQFYAVRRMALGAGLRPGPWVRTIILGALDTEGMANSVPPGQPRSGGKSGPHSHILGLDHLEGGAVKVLASGSGLASGGQVRVPPLRIPSYDPDKPDT